MRAILLPVKEFRRSKERLAPRYSEDEREALARAMCEDTFRVVAQAKGVDRVYVVSAEYHALALARQLNWHVIDESEQVSESASVDAASRHCARDGVRALLRLPIDLPLLTFSDIETQFYFLEPAPSVVIVPSRDGTGTNALLRSPPDLFPSNFGPGSFAVHLKQAEKTGAKVAIVRNERIALDIDEPEDVEVLNKAPPGGSSVARWLMTHAKIGARRGTVSLARNHDAWAEAFNVETSSLRAIFGPALHAIEHVGSTAVPNLSAKPIVDMVAAVPSLSEVAGFRTLLERAGWHYRANGSDETKILFVKGPEERRTYHLHIVEWGSDAWNRFVAFRDHLRANPSEARNYEALKQGLAARFADDRKSYTAGKRQYIESVVAKATGQKH